MNLGSETVVGVIGAGTMGRGIAQVAATQGHTVCLVETNDAVLNGCKKQLEDLFAMLVSKGKVTAEESKKILGRISYSKNLKDLAPCGFVIEAVIEDLSVKKEIFKSLESIVSESTILASNTSSLSITSIASACQKKERVIGVHFFNPAPLMALVEIIPSFVTDPSITASAKKLIDSWGKKTVIAKDMPGFIVNRIARPYYGEAIRIYEENLATFEEIDGAMKELGSFRMGPFELMDLIGNDVNLKVTHSVFESFFYDSRYRPSFTQQRLVEAGWLGKKSQRGYYDYSPGSTPPQIAANKKNSEMIFLRILSMLINEAADALYLNIASREDIDTAITLGVNYPKGLLRWCDELGSEKILSVLDGLFEEYKEERYRASVLLRRNVKLKAKFY